MTKMFKTTKSSAAKTRTQNKKTVFPFILNEEFKRKIKKQEKFT